MRDDALEVHCYGCKTDFKNMKSLNQWNTRPDSSLNVAQQLRDTLAAAYELRKKDGADTLRPFVEGIITACEYKDQGILEKVK